MSDRITRQLTAERVEAGIQWLDEQDAKLYGNDPSDRWFDHINLDTFNIESPCNCVLGQTAHHILPKSNQERLKEGVLGPSLGYCEVVFDNRIDDGDSPRATGRLITAEQAVEYGFESDRDVEYEDLQREWVSRISELQGAPR